MIGAFSSRFRLSPLLASVSICLLAELSLLILESLTPSNRFAAPIGRVDREVRAGAEEPHLPKDSQEVSVSNRSSSRHQPRSFGQRLRSGLATLEFAVCLPMIITMVFASVEASSMIFLKLSLQISAYDAARVAGCPSGTAT